MGEHFALDEAAHSLKPPMTPVTESDKSEDWSHLFYDMDKYDWNDPHWKRLNKRRRFGFLPIPLTQGYFMIVLIRDYDRMTMYPDRSPKSWYSNIQYDKWGNLDRIYGVRRGRGNEPRSVLAHREAMDCLEDERVVDHVNGYSLDNRADTDKDVNLILCSQRMNGHNARSNRRVNKGLPRGVVMLGKNEKGKQLYGWIRSHRLSPDELRKKQKAAGSKPVHPVDYVRSPESWTSPETAHEEYEKEIDRITGGRKSWAYKPDSVKYPKFPPLMDSEPKPRKTRRQEEKERLLEDIPF